MRGKTIGNCPYCNLTLSEYNEGLWCNGCGKTGHVSWDIEHAAVCPVVSDNYGPP